MYCNKCGKSSNYIHTTICHNLHNSSNSDTCGKFCRIPELNRYGYCGLCLHNQCNPVEDILTDKKKINNHLSLLVRYNSYRQNKYQYILISKDIIIREHSELLNPKEIVELFVKESITLELSYIYLIGKYINYISIDDTLAQTYIDKLKLYINLPNVYLYIDKITVIEYYRFQETVEYVKTEIIKRLQTSNNPQVINNLINTIINNIIAESLNHGKINIKPDHCAYEKDIVNKHLQK